MIVPTILAFFKESCKVAKLKDDIIKHRLNPIASIKSLVKHQLRVNKGHMHNGRVNKRISVYQTKIRIGDSLVKIMKSMDDKRLQSSLYEKLIYI